MGSQCYLPPGRGDFPAFTSAEAGTRFSDPERMQGWVDISTLGANSLPAQDYYSTASRLRFEPMLFRAWARHANHSASQPPNALGAVFAKSLWPSVVIPIHLRKVQIKFVHQYIKVIRPRSHDRNSTHLRLKAGNLVQGDHLLGDPKLGRLVSLILLVPLPCRPICEWLLMCLNPSLVIF